MLNILFQRKPNKCLPGFKKNLNNMTPEQKANEIAHKLGGFEETFISAMQMYQWAQDEFMQKAEKAYCNQCIKNPCRIKIEHRSLCYECELFLKSILKEL